MAWKDVTNIKGATGAKGDKGDRGIQGVAGDGGLTTDAAVAHNIAVPSATQTALDASYTRRDFTGPSSLINLPQKLDAQWRYNSSSYSQDNVVTMPDGTIYAVWINSSLRATIGKLNPGSSAWQTFDLRTIAGDPFGEQAADGHNVFTIGVDAAGIIHVAGNHHGDPLRYARSTSPGDITAWTTPGMIGTDEWGVTYPTFVNTADGTLYFTYRSGGSGNGNVIMNKRVGNAWLRVGVIFNGVLTNESPYINRVSVDWTGNGIHIMGCWRETGLASSNTDIFYAYSPDGGTTWRKSTGEAYMLPITHLTAETILPVEQGAGLINQCGMDVDVNGKPHGIFTLYDAAGNTQYHHVWLDGSTWRNDRVTGFTDRVETIGVNTLDLLVARPQIACTKEGRTLILGRANGLGDGALLIDVTKRFAPQQMTVFDMNLAKWEPSFDSRALRMQGLLRFLVTPLQSPAPAGVDWASRWAGILTLDATRIDQILTPGLAPFGSPDVDRSLRKVMAGEFPPGSRGKGSLADLSDLNAYYGADLEGVYHIPTSGTYPNFPAQIPRTAALYVEQVSPVLTVHRLVGRDGSTATRTRINGTWGSWGVAVVGGGASVPDGTDLRTLTPGVYHLVGPNTYPNEPAAFAALNVSGLLEILAPSSVLQMARLTSVGFAGIWHASIANGTWSAWTRTLG